LIVLGDVDEDLGQCMLCGTIVLLGRAGAYLGIRMYGGEIIVRGNGGQSVGGGMNGGKIMIFGDMSVAVDFEGTLHVFGDLPPGPIRRASPGYSTPGEIHVYGDVTSLPDVFYCELYYKERLVERDS
jgi:hypothetical protein